MSGRGRGWRKGLGRGAANRPLPRLKACPDCEDRMWGETRQRRRRCPVCAEKRRQLKLREYQKAYMARMPLGRRRELYRKKAARWRAGKAGA